MNENLLLEMFDCGIEKLIKIVKRPDISLAKYFSVISNIEDIPIVFRDISMDAMVFCENDNDFPVSVTKKEIIENYKKTRHLLIK